MKRGLRRVETSNSLIMGTPRFNEEEILSISQWHIQHLSMRVGVTGRNEALNSDSRGLRFLGGVTRVSCIVEIYSRQSLMALEAVFASDDEQRVLIPATPSEVLTPTDTIAGYNLVIRSKHCRRPGVRWRVELITLTSTRINTTNLRHSKHMTNEADTTRTNPRHGKHTTNEADITRLSCNCIM